MDDNTKGSDGCSEMCVLEPGFAGFSSGLERSTGFNDFIVLARSEQCDDGNSVQGDGCSNCVVDLGFVCTSAGGLGGVSVCSTSCNGPAGALQTAADVCADGNTNAYSTTGVARDSCAWHQGTGACRIHPRASCARLGATGALVCVQPTALCGNGVVETGETCDGGNAAVDGNGCSATCQADAAGFCVEQLGVQVWWCVRQLQD
eukprot:comp22541_c0_seq24/m.57214 comp22541_c0_seq24/g.57214  ORF comp22541_c0_seq24/g.57214 comp22541_c0_seq24/m.57214 type:complete len:204 (-) comp22541_c0_seq24:2151-2762(-)